MSCSYLSQIPSLLTLSALCAASTLTLSACQENDTGIVQVSGSKDEDAGAPRNRRARNRASDNDGGVSDGSGGDDDASDDDVMPDDASDDDASDDDASDDDVMPDDASDDDASDDDASDDDASDDDTTASDDDMPSDDTADDDVMPSDDDGAGGTGPVQPAGGTGGQNSPGGGAGGTSGASNVAGQAGSGGTPVVVTGCGANVVDDFSSCDLSICERDGRIGGWFDFAGDGIGLDVDQTGVRYPTSDWVDETCAVMLAGGDNLIGTEFYAGVGLALNDYDPYDLTMYQGVRFTIETGALVDFTLRTAADEYFIGPSAVGQTTGGQSFSIDFAAMIPRGDNPSAVLNLTLAKEFQWTVVAPEAGFGMAIHLVEVY